MDLETKIKQLVAKHDDEPALAELAALGQPVLPVLRRAYARLDWDDFIMPQWYNRIMAAIAPDPVGEALALLSKVKERHYAELAWLVRRFATPQDAPRFRRALARSMRTADADELAFRLPKMAVLCEALGMVGDEQDTVVLSRVFDIAQARLEWLERNEALHLSGPEAAPAAAAAAAALLSISERHSLDNAPDRERWRQACVEMALAQGYQNSYTITSLMNPPMPFLFTRAPAEASRVLDELAQAFTEADPLLSTIRYWLLVGQEQGVAVAIDLSANNALDWLDSLEECTGKDYGPQCALDIRAMLRPQAALAEAMWKLSRSPLDVKNTSHAVSIIRQVKAFADVAAVAVEDFFIQCSASREGLGPHEEQRQELGKLLKGAGLATISRWAWNAPEGRVEAIETVEGLNNAPLRNGVAFLNAALCAIATLCAQAAKSTTAQEALTTLRDLPAQPLIKHARYRNLLLALAATVDPTFLRHLESLRAEDDPGLVKAVLTMASALLGKEAGPVYLLLLDAPALREKPDLAEQVIKALAGTPTPEAGARILALGRELGWGSSYSDYGVYAAVTETVGRLGISEAAPTLISTLGQSGLGSNIEVALLKLAARDPRAVDDEAFAKAFKLAIADEYTDMDPSLIGQQARAYIVRVLSEESIYAPVFAHLCRFLDRAAKGSHPPPQALPLLLERLPSVIAWAKANPGEEWEDRNWGGYNATDAENTAEFISGAVESLCEGRYSRDDWRILIKGLLALPDIDLARVEMATSGAAYFRYITKNVFAMLRKNLQHVGDDRIKEALSRGTPLEALRAVLAFV